MPNQMSLPRATQLTLGALVAALLGWGILIYSTASHNDAAERWAAERSDLDGRVAELSRERRAARRHRSPSSRARSTRSAPRPGISTS